MAAGRRWRTDGPGGCWARWVTPLVLFFYFVFPTYSLQGCCSCGGSERADLIHSALGTATTTAVPPKMIMN